MATCIQCNKGWNSWGSNENLCSDMCESAYSYNLRSIVKSIVASITLHQAKTLYSLIGDEYLFHKAFEEELENKL